MSRICEVVEDGLVVLVHQHHDPLAVGGVGGGDQPLEASGQTAVWARHAKPDLVIRQQLADSLIELSTRAQHPLSKAQPDHREAPPPVPTSLCLEPTKQGLVAGEELSEGVEEQRFAEAPGAREEVVGPLFDQAQGEAGLIDVVVVTLADLAEGLDADRQAAAGHGCTR